MRSYGTGAGVLYRHLPAGDFMHYESMHKMGIKTFDIKRGKRSKRVETIQGPKTRERVPSSRFSRQ